MTEAFAHDAFEVIKEVMSLAVQDSNVLQGVVPDA